MHFELTDKTREFEGRTLFRIRATQDIPYFDVKAGDLGGWVEHEGNLGEDSWVFSEGIIMDNAFAGHRSGIHDQAIVRGESNIRNSSLYDHVIVQDHAYIYDSVLSGYVRIGGNAYLVMVLAHTDVVVEGRVKLVSCTVLGDAHISSSDELLELGNCHFLTEGVYITSRHHVVGFTQLGYLLSDDLKSIIPSSPDTIHSIHVFTVHDPQEGRIVPKVAFNGTYKQFDLEKAFTFLKFVDTYSNEGKYADEVAAIEALIRARVKSWVFAQP